MRTVADLREALIACEQPPPSVEHFLAKVPGAGADEISIVPAPVRRRRRPTLWITAAAVAAAVTAGSVVLINGVSGHSHAVSGGQDGTVEALSRDDLAMPFHFAAAANVTVESYSVSGDGIYENVRDSAGRLFMLWLARQTVKEVDLHPEHVDVNGATAIVSDARGDVAAASTAPPSGAAASSDGTAAIIQSGTTRRIQWQFDAERTFVLQTLSLAPSISKSDFVAFARSIVFAPRPLQLPFVVKSAPAGVRLSRINVLTKQSRSGWSYGAAYQLDGGNSRGYGITLSPTPVVTAKTETAMSKTIAGHTSYWLPVGTDGSAALTVDLGGIYLNVTEIVSGEPRQPAYEKFAAIAESVTLAPGSDDLNTWLEGKTWPDAAKALPLGS